MKRMSRNKQETKTKLQRKGSSLIQIVKSIIAKEFA
jgi:hypothetical protein